MKKQDEVEFYRRLRLHAAQSEGGRYFGPSTAIFRICDDIGMNYKRAYALLQKWVGKGWVDYGMWVWAGWFEQTAPTELVIDCVPRKELL